MADATKQGINDITWPRTFAGPNLLQIALPLGGIGAGCVCLNGHGGLQDFAIRNRPATTALADGHGTTDAAFALLHIKGEKPVTRLVEGPLPVEKLYDQGLQGQGYRKGGQEGLPRFAESTTFEGAYPFGTVRLTDPNLPLRAEITGWNPFVPRDDIASGVPGAILEYTLENTSGEPVEYELSFHLSHLVPGKEDFRRSRSVPIPGAGVFFFTNEDPQSEAFGSAALVALEGDPRIKAMWLRGGWFDSLSALWRETSEGAFRENVGRPAEAEDRGGRNGGSILLAGTLAPGERVTHPLAITWHFPNISHTVGYPPGVVPPSLWHPFYSTVWSDAQAVAQYLREHYADLRRRTTAFRDALAASTVPPVVQDAVASNLAILKSPTVLRQANGNVWGWEGCFVGSGCCHGTCTHVWNYAQALPHLFPALERTLREQEYLRSMDGRGHINFRAALPDAPTIHDYHAAADGQLGGIMKLYRDWQISGDTDWLARLYPLAKRSLDFCIAAWDPDKLGALFEPHHNTYDIEFWGPEPMCATVYVGALSAMAEMARALGNENEAEEYAELARRGAAYLDAELFNGDYYEQHVQWEGLRDTSFAREIAQTDDATDDEMALLLKREGPKYQYGTGCLSDGVIGAWMASLYGIETPLSQENVRAHLRAIFAHNFRADLSEHACTQRPGYALGHEGGLLLCSWPRGNKPTLPFVYSDEVWTGIEYQVAAHLFEEGLVDEGLAIVAAVRNRYDGRVRNPFNEYECGNYYARAMASFALLPALAGFRYSSAERTLWFGPRLTAADGAFATFFSTDAGFGLIRLSADTLTVELIEGELAVDRLILTQNGEKRALAWGAVARPGAPITLAV